MKTYKISLGFIIMMMFLLGFGILAVVFGIQIVREGGVNSQNGIGLIFLIVGSSYVWSGWMMLMQLIMDKGVGMRFTEEGIEQTFAIVNLFAFIFVAPIRFIPWDAVKEITSSKGIYRASVDLDKVEAGFMGKRLLHMAGFCFCNNMVKPSVERDDIRRYSGK